MDSVDLEVLKACARWMAEGHACQLVTVLKTWGSSPRPPGAMLAICDDGDIIGSVSGGCIEDDLIAVVKELGIHRTKPELLTYGLSSTDAHRFGLPCGGTMELLIEPLHEDSAIAELLDRLSAQELVLRQLCLTTGRVRLLPGTTDATLKIDGDFLHTPHGPRWRLLIIGAGQMSRFLAQIAIGLDYSVTVCDPREEYRAGWEIDGVTINCEMPDDVVIEMRLDAHSAVVAFSHDPKLDDLALMEALRSDAFYVGAIGSRHNNARRRERLKEFDLSDKQLQRLHGPIGLYIGSKTPAEIAISTMAEITAVKNGVTV